MIFIEFKGSNSESVRSSPSITALSAAVPSHWVKWEALAFRA